MNHYQFAGEGNPPYLVRTNDIVPEITNQEARDRVASLLSSHMKCINELKIVLYFYFVSL